MTPELSSSGVRIQAYSEIFDEIADKMRAIYGEEIDLSSNAPDGQRVAIMAKMSLDYQSFALASYNSRDPDLAEGDALDRILKLSGLTVRPATRSTWDVTVTMDRGATLPAGYTIADSAGQEWTLTTATAVATGANVVTFRAVDFGAISGNAGDTLTQSTVALGVTALNAAIDASGGVDGETPAEVRERRNNSLQNPAYSVLGKMYSSLADLSGVTDVAAYENDTDTVDANGIPGHTIWCIVEGGSVSDIVETMVMNKTAGTGTKGDNVGVYYETVDRPDGSTFTIPHSMRYDRSVEAPVYVKVTATRFDAVDPVDVELIASEIAEMDFLIGDDILASSLYELGYNAGDGFTLTDMQVSLDGDTYTSGRLQPALNGKPSIDPENVDVTEVVSNE